MPYLLGIFYGIINELVSWQNEAKPYNLTRATADILARRVTEKLLAYIISQNLTK